MVRSVVGDKAAVVLARYTDDEAKSCLPPKRTNCTKRAPSPAYYQVAVETGPSSIGCLSYRPTYEKPTT